MKVICNRGALLEAISVAGNVVPGYQPWRPFWLLSASWVLLLAHLGLELVHAYAWSWIPDLALFGLTAVMCWRW